MKKLTVMTIVLAVLLALTTAVCAAEVGETKTVSFDLGEAMVAGDYTITYDPAYLEFVSVTPSRSVNDKTAGKVVVSFYDGDTDTVTVTFRAVKEVEKDTAVEVTFVPGEFGNMDREVVPVEGATKTVTLTAPVIEPPVSSDVPPVSSDVPPVSSDVPPVSSDVPASSDVPPVSSEESVVPPTSSAPVESSTPAPSTDDEGEDKATYDKTGVSVAYVGIIALVVIAGAAVLIKRK